jgi:hypothetical protein
LKTAGTALLKPPAGIPVWPGLTFLSAVLTYTGLFAFVSPAPLMAGYVKPGRILFKLLLTVLLVLGLGFLDRWAAAAFLVFAVIPAAILAPYLKGQMDLRDAFLTLAGFTFLLAGVIWSLKAFGGFDLAGTILARFNEALDLAISRWGGKPGWSLNEVEVGLVRDAVASALGRYGVATLFLGVMTSSVSNIFLSFVFLRDSYSPKSVRSDFAGWETDFWVMLLFLLLWAGVMTGLFLKNDLIRVVSLNGLMMAGWFYLLQGLAVFAAGFKRLPGPGLLKLFIVLVLLQFVPLLVVATAVFGFGLLDEWFHFRRITIPSGGVS